MQWLTHLIFPSLLYIAPIFEKTTVFTHPQVGLDGNLTKSLSMSSQSGPVTCVDWLQGARSMSTCITASLDGSVYVTGLLRSMNPT